VSYAKKIKAYILACVIIALNTITPAARADEPEPTPTPEPPPYVGGGVTVVPPMIPEVTIAIDENLTEEAIRRHLQEIENFRKQQALGRKAASYPAGSPQRQAAQQIQQNINRQYTTQQLETLAANQTLLQLAGVGLSLVDWGAIWDAVFDNEELMQEYINTGNLIDDVIVNFTLIGPMYNEMLSAARARTEITGPLPADQFLQSVWRDINYIVELYPEGLEALNRWMKETFGETEGPQTLPEIDIIMTGIWKNARVEQVYSDRIDYSLPYGIEFDYFHWRAGWQNMSIWVPEGVHRLQVRIYDSQLMIKQGQFWRNNSWQNYGATYDNRTWFSIYNEYWTVGQKSVNMAIHGSNNRSYPSPTTWWGIPIQDINNQTGHVERFIDFMKTPDAEERRVPVPLPNPDLSYRDQLEDYIDRLGPVIIPHLDPDLDLDPGTEPGDGDPGTEPTTPPTHPPGQNAPPASFAMFPFCIPWDVHAAFRAMSATPAEPRFEINIFPQDMQARYGMTLSPIIIDFTHFNTVRVITRNLMLALFVIGMITVTRRYIWTGGG